MKNFASFIALCITTNTFAQLSERVVVTPKKENICLYDTLSNYPKKWGEYIGQEIIFLPIDTAYCNANNPLWKDYNCFFSDSLLNSHYINKETPKEYIDNKKFRVLNYKKMSAYQTNHKPGLTFKLLSHSNDTIYWHISCWLDDNSITNNYNNSVRNEKDDNRLPVLIDSYIQRIQKYIGQKFIAKTNIKKKDFRLATSGELNDDEMVDINTGKERHCPEFCVNGNRIQL